MPGVDPRARRRARRALLQALYQWQMTAAGLDEMRAQFRATGALDNADEAFFDEALQFVINHVTELDAAFIDYLDRDLGDLGFVERGVLRAGTYELRERIEVPYRVVINEWVELTKSFGATDSYKYINGVLDAVSKDLRAVERQ